MASLEKRGIGLAKEERVYNIDATTGGTEYSHTFADKTKSYMIKTRGNHKLQVSFSSGQSGVEYLEIPKNSSYSSSDMLLVGKTIYFQSPSDNVIVEIVERV